MQSDWLDRNRCPKEILWVGMAGQKNALLKHKVKAIVVTKTAIKVWGKGMVGIFLKV